MCVACTTMMFGCVSRSDAQNVSVPGLPANGTPVLSDIHESSPAVSSMPENDGLLDALKGQSVLLEEAGNASDFMSVLNIAEKTAALAAASPLSSEAGAYTDSVIQHAAALISVLEIRKVSSPPETVKNTPFRSDFFVRIVRSDTGLPVSGFPVTIRYPVSGHNGEYEYETESAVSAADGLVVFSSPVPSFACNSSVDIFSGAKCSVAAVSDVLSDVFLSLPYKVSTDLRAKGGSIALVDFDKAGRPVTTNSRSSSALLTALIKRGFSRIGNSDFTAPIVAGSDSGVYTDAKKLFGGSVMYLIYGTVKYDTVEKNSSGYTVALTAQVKAIDMRDSSELFSTTAHAAADGRTEYAALEAARDKLTAGELAEKLIYGR